MIYLDTSVALAHLLSEDRQPPDSLWSESLVASRLLECELWTRVHARQLTASHGELVRALTGRVAFLELAPNVIGRALEPFPLPVRTLDAIHLASVEFLRGQHLDVHLASYDERMIAAARRLKIPLLRL